jgi:hypothetical protein
MKLGSRVGLALLSAVVASTVAVVGVRVGAGERESEVVGTVDPVTFCAGEGYPGRPLRIASRWNCVGRLNGVWQALAVDVDALCTAQFGPDVLALAPETSGTPVDVIACGRLG